MSEQTLKGPILRLFEVEAKPGCADQLLRNFATTSADVVQNEPGNAGYFFGQGIEQDGNRVIFASLWESLDAIKARFGDDWQQSFLPPGYNAMIETHHIRHIDLSGGWNPRL